MKFLIIIFLLLTSSCYDPKKQTKVQNAVEIICPGAPSTLVLGVTKQELRTALRKQFSHDRTRDTVLKLKDGTNIMIPTIRPRDLDRCIVRSYPVVVPTSQGY